ncbi:hypothetical protein CBR_g40493 [Chara braunii]|uniref:Zinc-finger domain-containing protein n=1 Tax=Chara braunii TaxID=69332 RepID=A0A388LTW4_CHABU|nr:hypothetical protein CBR_g40493 [Chara braunii]|eukprot:GBG85764.1 hypothetical protein CBR_g40493 [Chara braunii]
MVRTRRTAPPSPSPPPERVRSIPERVRSAMVPVKTEIKTEPEEEVVVPIAVKVKTEPVEVDIVSQEAVPNAVKVKPEPEELEMEMVSQPKITCVPPALQPKGTCSTSGMTPYEIERLARIAENRARMEAQGLATDVSNLTRAMRSVKSHYTPRRTRKVVAGKMEDEEDGEYNGSSQGVRSRSSVAAAEPVRRSRRLQHAAPILYAEGGELDEGQTRVKRESGDGLESDFSRFQPSSAVSLSQGSGYGVTSKRRKVYDLEAVSDLPQPSQLPQYLQERRCDCRDRGSVYDPVVGLCCHFCRQKKLCGEEDCERCGYMDINKMCLGKTFCNRCKSATGIFCRACIKIRYGQTIEEVRADPAWLCPHCKEEEGTDPYFICNSSICMRKKNLPALGIVIHTARNLGYASVQQYVAASLKGETSTKCLE